MKDELEELSVWYDDQPDRVMDRVNKHLAKVGWKFVDDGKEHDGWIAYKLEKLTGKETE